MHKKIYNNIKVVFMILFLLLIFLFFAFLGYIFAKRYQFTLEQTYIKLLERIYDYIDKFESFL
jgi:hypothetical protein